MFSCKLLHLEALHSTAKSAVTFEKPPARQFYDSKNNTVGRLHSQGRINLPCFSIGFYPVAF